MNVESECLAALADVLHVVQAEHKNYVIEIYFVINQIVEFVRRELARSTIDAMLRVLYRDCDVWFAVAPRDIIGVVCLYAAGDGTFCGYRHNFDRPRPHPGRETIYRGQILPNNRIACCYPRYEYDVMDSPLPMIVENGPDEWRREWVVAGLVSRVEAYYARQYIDVTYCNGYRHGINHHYDYRRPGENRMVYCLHGQRLAVETGNPPVTEYYPPRGETVDVPGPYNVATMRTICYPLN